MARLSSPKKFSRYFEIDPKLLRARGAFDPILNADTELFIDPLLLAASREPELRKADETWCAHFENLLKLLVVASGENDPPYRAALKMLTFKEFKGTSLGYGGGIDGNAIGPELAAQMTATARRIVELGVKDPALFALIPVMEDNVGADRISDMTTRLIARELAAYTERMLADQEISLTTFNILGTDFRLPANPFELDRGKPLPIFLVPLDVLRHLPVAMDWGEVTEAAGVNATLRVGVNDKIATAFERAKGKYDRKLLLLSDNERLARIIVKLKEKAAEHGYDIEPELVALEQWVDLAEQLAMANTPSLQLKSRDLAGVTELVREIIAQYQYSIENGGWKTLYNDDGSRRHESIPQLIFLAVADNWCKANNIDISPETNQGGGAVDFKFSAGYDSRVVVEMKWSSNSSLLRGYEKQLEIYKKQQRTKAGFYVVLDNGFGAPQIQAVLNAKNAKERAKEPHSEVAIIDATPKESASKQ